MSLDIVFKVSPVDVPGMHSPSPDIRVSTVKDHRRLLHVSVVQPDHVAISYVGASELTANSIQVRHVQEFSSDVTVESNSWRYRNTLKIPDRRFTYHTKDALITHMTKSVGSKVFPLWYKHTFNWEISNLRSVRIANNFGVDLSNEKYTVLLQNGEVIIAHNVESGLDDTPLGVTFYLVEYTDINGFRRKELLKNTPLYRRATILDQGIAQSCSYVSEYIEGVPDSFSFRIFFQRDENGVFFDGPWYIRPLSQHQLQLVSPDHIRPNARWSLRITDGDVIGHIQDGPLRYSLPEYHLQSFLPIEPMKYTRGSEAGVIGQKIVKLPFSDMIADDPAMPIDILILDENFGVRAGFTTGDSGRNWEGRLDQWAVSHPSLAQELMNLGESGGSISAERGLLHLPLTLNSSDRVFVMGHYSEKSYEFSLLNLNPVLNPSMRNGKAIVYILSNIGLEDYPEGEVRRGAHYIIVDRENSIREWSHYSLSDPNNEGSINPIYENLPAGTTQYDKFLAENTSILIIGEVSIDRAQSPDELSYIDVRHKNGRIRRQAEEQIENLAQVTPELLWLSENSLAERSIPFHNALSAILPKEKFEDFNFTEKYATNFLSEDIEDALRHHAAAGSSLVWECDTYDLSVDKAVVLFLENKASLLIPDGVADLTGAKLGLTIAINNKLYNRISGQGELNEDGSPVHTYQIFARVSAVAPKLDSEGIAELTYEELEIDPVGMGKIISLTGADALEIPEDLISLIDSKMYLYVVVKQDGKDVARTEILEFRIKKGDELAYSGHTSFFIDGTINPSSRVSFFLTGEIE